MGKHIMELSITEAGTYRTTSGEVIEIGEEFFNDAMKMSAQLIRGRTGNPLGELLSS